jgi:hypothetical protein
MYWMIVMVPDRDGRHAEAVVDGGWGWRLTKRVRESRIRQVLPESGPVAQLGARFHGMEEVTGSIPVRSTK